MPKMGGLEVLSIIRTKRPFIDDPILQNIPVVVMSASPLRGNAKRLMDRGANDVIAKPIRRARLRQLLLQWSRREVVPLAHRERMPEQRVMVRPFWGPMPLRGYRGPRSLL